MEHGVRSEQRLEHPCVALANSAVVLAIYRLVRRATSRSVLRSERCPTSSAREERVSADMRIDSTTFLKSRDAKSIEIGCERRSTMF